MRETENVLHGTELLELRLRSLYERYGYRKYKMSRFEEYSLYLENRNFLKSDRVITFTDDRGKLLAMKPDITLSIVKSAAADGASERVYYSENIFRAASGSAEMREMRQVGLEYLGRVDLYAESEVLILALESLAAVGRDHIMGITHLGLVTGLLDATELPEREKASISRLIGQKNAHEIAALCAACGVGPTLSEKLCALASIYGTFPETRDALRNLVVNKATESAVAELCELYSILQAAGYGDALRVDFSIVNDLSYYNGITFQGFVEGIPESVLSGGRYDNLLQRMGKGGAALGFAVYMDELERLEAAESLPDTDILFIYPENAPAAEIAKAMRELTCRGRVYAATEPPAQMTYRELVEWKGEAAK